MARQPEEAEPASEAGEHAWAGWASEVDALVAGEMVPPAVALAAVGDDSTTAASAVEAGRTCSWGGWEASGDARECATVEG